MKLVAHLQFHITTCSYYCKNYCTQYYSLGLEASDIAYFYTSWIAKKTKQCIIEQINTEFSLKAQWLGSNYLMLITHLCIDSKQVLMMAEWSYKTHQDKCPDCMQLKILVLNLKILNGLRTWMSKEPFLPLRNCQVIMKCRRCFLENTRQLFTFLAWEWGIFFISWKLCFDATILTA